MMRSPRKVATAVQLRVDLDRANLPGAVRERLEKIAGRQVNQRGELVITASRFRTQGRNRADAVRRLADLLDRAGRRHGPGAEDPDDAGTLVRT